MRRLRIPDNLTTLAYRTIKDYIWEGRLDHGARLTEDFIARQLGISKSPVREALNRLESEGLIRIQPRKGAFLRSYTTKEVQDLYGVREALEAYAVATAIITPALVDALRRTVERAREFMLANDKARYIEEDVRFHTLLAGAAGNQLLSKSLENIQQQVWLFRRKTYDFSRSRAVTVHTAIVKALAKGDKAAAERLMREHIAHVRDKLVSHLAGENAQGQAAGK